MTLEKPSLTDEVRIMLPEKTGILSLNLVDLNRETGELIIYCHYESKITGNRLRVTLKGDLPKKDRDDY